jgi:FkbM family methyltransferase
MNFNKVCEIEDWGDSELVEVMRDVCAHKLDDLPGFPKGTEHRKDWEVAMAVRALRHFDALRPDSLVLGVAAGTEDTLFYLTRHVRQVYSTDRYLAPGDWGPTAPVSMLLDPAGIAPGDFDANRLVVQHMDARALRYPDDTFDGVFSSGSIEHVGELMDVANAAYEMGRVLKPGGVVSLSTELMLSGPPGGIGWPGLTLIISPDNLAKYIVEASGLVPVDELVVTVSDETMGTKRQLSAALADHEGRVEAADDKRRARYTEWEFPHVVLEHGEYVLTSVHLTLRKPEDGITIDNSWAAPSAQTLASIREWDRSLLGGVSAGAPSQEPAPPAAGPAPPGPSRADPPRQTPGPLHSGPSPRVTHRLPGLGASTSLENRVVRRLASLTDVSSAIAELDRLRAAVVAPLGRFDELQQVARAAIASHEQHGSPAPSLTAFSSEWREVLVMGGEGGEKKTFVAVVDPAVNDPITMTLLGGQVLEKTNVALMLDLLGGTGALLDVGAHLGQFSLSAAAAGAAVLAVEASPSNAALLRAAAARNGFDRFHVVQSAVSDRPGTLEFVSRGPWGHVGAGHIGEGGTVVSVPAVTLDELLAEFDFVPTFVKMDVEGSEVAALDGMAGFLSRPDAPPLLFESNGHTLKAFGITTNDLLAKVESFGYTAHAIEDDRIVRTTSADFQPQTIVDHLAFKAPPPGLEGSRVDAGYDADERVAKIVIDCRSPNDDHRAYMASALAGAGQVLLSHPLVIETLDALVADPSEAVRAAASWWKKKEVP